MPLAADEFLSRLAASGVLPGEEIERLADVLAEDRPADGEQLARELVRRKLLTKYQSEQIYSGRGRELVLGNYVVLDRLGQGGMGLVLKAEHRRMRRVVALKTIAPDLVRTPEALARFQREVHAAARLEHPNIVAAYDADVVGATHFLVMQYVDGLDLASLVKAKGPLSAGKAAECVLQAARGLHYAHEHGVIHRDIKPGNLLLDREGTVKILDMGLARIESADGSQAELTGTGTVMGTVDYMAPEQAEDTRRVDARADIYSLGCTLHYLVSGRPVYDGETVVKRLLAHRERPVPSLRETGVAVPDTLDAIYRRMIAKRREDRQQTMAEVVEDLERYLSGDARTSSLSGPATQDGRIGDFLRQLDGQAQPATATASRPRAAAFPQAAALDATVRLGTSKGDPDPETITSLTRGALQPPAKGPWWRSRRTQLAAGLAGVLVLLAGIVIRITTRDGKTTEVEIPPGAKVEIVERDDAPPQPNPPPKTPAARRRAAAEWIMSEGRPCWIQHLETSTVVEAVQPSELPPAFLLRVASLYHAKDLQTADLQRLNGLWDIRVLDCSNTDVDAAALPIIAGFTCLQQLDISQTRIPASSLDALRHLPALTTLTLSSSQIDDSTFLEFLPALRELIVAGDSNAFPDLIPLAQAKQLRTLRLRDGGSIEPDDVATMQKQNPRLRVVVETDDSQAHVVGVDPAAETARWLVERGFQLNGYAGGRREALELTATDITGPSPIAVFRLAAPEAGESSLDDRELVTAFADTLHYVQFRNAQQADGLAKQLSTCGGLWTVDLTRSDLTDEGLEQLKSLTGLTWLDVTNTQVTQAGVEHFHRAVPGCRIKSGFGQLGGIVRIPERPAPASELASPADRRRAAAEWVLSQGKSVTVQPVDSANIVVVDRAAELPAEFLLRRVWLDRLEHVTSRDLDRLRGIPELWELHCMGTGIDAQALPCIAECTSLQFVNLANTAIRSSSLVALRQLPVLNGVRISSSQIDDDWQSLRELPALRSLFVFKDTPELPDLSPLQDVAQLRTLTIEGAGVDPAVVAELEAGNPHLRVVASVDGERRALGRDPVAESARALIEAGIQLRGYIGERGSADELTLAEIDASTFVNVASLTVPEEVEFGPELRRQLTSLAGQFRGVGFGKGRDADESARILGEDGALWNLDFGASDLTDEGLRHLEALAALKTLDVRRTSVSQAGVERFHRRVPGCQLLTDFGTYPASLETPERPAPQVATPHASQSREYEAAEWVIAQGGGITVLDTVDRSYINCRTVEEFPASFVVTTVSLDSADVTSGDVRRLDGLAAVYDLVLARTPVDRSALATLADWPVLQSLNIAGTSILASDLVALRPMPVLATLYIDADQVDDGWKSLRGLPSLRTLKIWKRDGELPELAPLGDLAQLRWLHIPDVSNLDAGVVAELQRRNPRLRVIVGYGADTRALGADPLANAARALLDKGVEITAGTRDSGRISASAESEIPVLPNHLMLSPKRPLLPEDLELFAVFAGQYATATVRDGAGCDDLAHAISENAALSNLSWHDCDLTDAGLEQLHPLVGLRSLTLYNTRVTRQGIERFREAVPNCQMWTSLGNFKPLSWSPE